MRIDWHLTQPVKGLDYPDALTLGRTVAGNDDGPAQCRACNLGRPCGAQECPNNVPVKIEVVQ